MSTQVLTWVGFNVFVLIMLGLDLGIFHRRDERVTPKEAAIWTGVWVSLALCFDVGLYFWSGSEVALQFLTGYIIEESLSMDNMFVFVMIFSFFAVPAIYQHRVLYWGILGALIMRATMILLGASLVHRFEWILYVFGAFLIFTGIRMAFQDDHAIEPENNRVIQLFRKFMPIADHYDGHHFFTVANGKRLATPLFLVLLVIESSDVMFAVDSIPAIFSVTTDPFIVYSSNVFAILGLRSLYFLLAGIMGLFRYLKYGLGIVLTFVGLKMVLADIVHIPIALSLGVIAVILAVSIVASLLAGPADDDLAETAVSKE